MWAKNDLSNVQNPVPSLYICWLRTGSLLTGCDVLLGLGGAAPGITAGVGGAWDHRRCAASPSIVGELRSNWARSDEV